MNLICIVCHYSTVAISVPTYLPSLSLQRPPIPWTSSSDPSAAALVFPYLLTFSKSKHIVSVYSLLDQQIVQEIPFAVSVGLWMIGCHLEMLSWRGRGNKLYDCCTDCQFSIQKATVLVHNFSMYCPVEFSIQITIILKILYRPVEMLHCVLLSLFCNYGDSCLHQNGRYFSSSHGKLVAALASSIYLLVRVPLKEQVQRVCVCTCTVFLFFLFSL